MYKVFKNKVTAYFNNLKKNRILKNKITEENNRINKQNILINNLLRNKDYYMLNKVIEDGVSLTNSDQLSFKMYSASIVRDCFYRKEKTNKILYSHYVYDQNVDSDINDLDELLKFYLKMEGIIDLKIIFNTIAITCEKFNFYKYHFDSSNILKDKTEYFQGSNVYEQCIDNIEEESFSTRIMRLTYSNDIDKSFFMKNNKDYMMTIHSFINRHLEEYIYYILNVKNSMFNIDKIIFLNKFILFVDAAFGFLSEDMKKVAVNLASEIYYENENKKNGENLKNFINKNQHYRESINIDKFVKKNFNKDVKVNNHVESSVIINGKDYVITIEKLLKSNQFPSSINGLCAAILKNYDNIVLNEENINIESFLLIKKLVEEKVIIALSNLLSVGELNKLLKPNRDSIEKNSEECSICINSLNGINDILIRELENLKEIKKEKMLVLNNYIHAER